jgi:hypothetical protein
MMREGKCGRGLYATEQKRTTSAQRSQIPESWYSRESNKTRESREGFHYGLHDWKSYYENVMCGDDKCGIATERR